MIVTKITSVFRAYKEMPKKTDLGLKKKKKEKEEKIFADYLYNNKKS